MSEKKFVIKTHEGQYWKSSFPHWVSNINNVTPLSEEEAQNKVDELDSEVNTILYIKLLEEEYRIYRLKNY